MEQQNFFNLDTLEQLDSFEKLDLERTTSNPLLRCLSNLSTTSQDGGATFVPYGRGQKEYLTSSDPTNIIDFDDINKLIQQHKKTTGEKRSNQPQPQIPPVIGEQKTPEITPHLSPEAKPFQPYQPPMQAIPFAPIIQPIIAPIRPQPRPYIIPIMPTMPQPMQPKAVRHKAKIHNRKKPLHRMEIKDIIKQNISLDRLLNANLICKLLKDQNGSRFIQDKLTKNNVHKSKNLIDIVLKHIIYENNNSILELSEDIFGNYVIQIFFEICNKQQIKLLINKLLLGNCHRLTHSLYGCRVIQKAFDCISNEQCIQLIEELSDNNNEIINKYIIGPNSNHVIQKILTLSIDNKYFEWINKCIMNNINYYSSHIFGCRIVQNLIKCDNNNNNNNELLLTIVSNDRLLFNLCKSEYGNYVIQDILNYNNKNNKIITLVKSNIFKNILNLSKNKFGSNVVEKCLIICKEKDIDILLNKLLVKKGKRMIFVDMIQDKFANYVIQKLLNISNHKQQSRIIYFVQKNINNLKGLKYGKHIMDKIKKITKSEYYEYRY